MFGFAKTIPVVGFAVLPMALAACSGSVGMEATDSELGAEDLGFYATDPTEQGADPRETASDETLARVIVERSDNLDGAESGQALAHFVQLVSGSERSLELVGLDRKLPNIAAGDAVCRTDFSVAGAAVNRAVELELLDAGSVEIRTTRAGAQPADAQQAVVTLAPHAFPSVSSFASGLVYTTRDRSAGALPSDARYQVVISGARSVPRLEVAGSAPSELSQVTLGGVPLAQIRGIDAKAPLDVTWQVGRPGDIVYVELAGNVDGETRLVCAFPDEAGSATIPAEFLEGARGAVRFSIHRVRAVMGAATAPEPEPPPPNGYALGPTQTPRLRTELRFDFDLSRSLVVGDELFVGDAISDDQAVDPSGVDPSGVDPSGDNHEEAGHALPVHGADVHELKASDSAEAHVAVAGTEGASGATPNANAMDPASTNPTLGGSNPTARPALERAARDTESVRAVVLDAAERGGAGSDLPAQGAPIEHVVPSTGELASDGDHQARPAP